MYIVVLIFRVGKHDMILRLNDSTPLYFIFDLVLAYIEIFHQMYIVVLRRTFFFVSKLQANYLELVYLVTALVPSETACLANSPGRRSLTAVWISREVMVDLLL